MTALIGSTVLGGRQLVCFQVKAAHASRCPPSSTAAFSVEIILLGVGAEVDEAGI
jgi:hypothetical protein